MSGGSKRLHNRSQGGHGCWWVLSTHTCREPDKSTAGRCCMQPQSASAASGIESLAAGRGVQEEKANNYNNNDEAPFIILRLITG